MPPLGVHASAKTPLLDSGDTLRSHSHTSAASFFCSNAPLKNNARLVFYASTRAPVSGGPGRAINLRLLNYFNIAWRRASARERSGKMKTSLATEGDARKRTDGLTAAGYQVFLINFNAASLIQHTGAFIVATGLFCWHLVDHVAHYLSGGIIKSVPGTTCCWGWPPFSLSSSHVHRWPAVKFQMQEATVQMSWKVLASFFGWGRCLSLLTCRGHFTVVNQSYDEDATQNFNMMF